MLGCRRGRGGRERPTRWNLAAKMLTWRWLAQRVQHLWELDRLCVGSIGFRCIISWELHSLPVLLTDLRVFVAAQAAFASSSAFHSGEHYHRGPEAHSGAPRSAHQRPAARSRAAC